MASVACNSSLSVAAATVQCGAGKKRSSGGRKAVACPAFEGLSSRSLSLRITESVDLNSELESKRPESRSVTVCSLKDLRDRIATVKNTQKITDAMKLVAAAKVRRAQEAVVNGRPFSENLVKVLFNVNSQLQTEDIDIPLTQVSRLELHYQQET
jgi:F-type H+-transporting ATPase subunit gamma